MPKPSSTISTITLDFAVPHASRPVPVTSQQVHLLSGRLWTWPSLVPCVKAYWPKCDASNTSPSRLANHHCSLLPSARNPLQR